MTATRLIPPLSDDARGLNSRVPASEVHGQVSIHEGILAPGERVPTHTHLLDDQVAYVVEGRVCFEVGDDRVEAEAGSFVVKPRGVPHSEWNDTDVPARMIEITTSDRFERFIAGAAAIHADDTLDDADRDARFDRLRQEHGMAFAG